MKAISIQGLPIVEGGGWSTQSIRTPHTAYIITTNNVIFIEKCEVTPCKGDGEFSALKYVLKGGHTLFEVFPSEEIRDGKFTNVLNVLVGD